MQGSYLGKCHHRYARLVYYMATVMGMAYVIYFLQLNLKTMNTDSKGNAFEDVGNIRVTYVNRNSREGETVWAERDVLRIQAYKSATSNALHPGAEIPLEDAQMVIELVEAFCKLYRGSLSR